MCGPGAMRESQPRFKARARVRPKAQLTLPEEIRRAMHVSEGDEIEFAGHADGTITVRGYVSVPSDQAWFFTPEGLAGKQQAERDRCGRRHGACIYRGDVRLPSNAGCS
jgi:bifunctional DNA-binding transcriptional regulator/antitoxin component of YhaV-PrlF toxin-antitoxin module